MPKIYIESNIIWKLSSGHRQRCTTNRSLYTTKNGL